MFAHRRGDWGGGGGRESGGGGNWVSLSIAVRTGLSRSSRSASAERSGSEHGDGVGKPSNHLGPHHQEWVFFKSDGKMPLEATSQILGFSRATRDSLLLLQDSIGCQAEDLG